MTYALVGRTEARIPILADLCRGVLAFAVAFKDTFLAHYHKRSNVESTFSMIKVKFGDSIRSKTDTAMVNETLCKILCHNICCLIQSMFELKIEATFWGEAEEKPTEIAKEPAATDQVEEWVWV